MNDAAITKLVQRVGWAPLILPFVTGIAVSADALKADSRRVFKAFHALATAENVFWSIPNPDANSNETFNTALLELREQAVRKIIHRVFVANSKAMFGTDGSGNPVDLSETDYSELAIKRAALFDDAIGYQVACDVIEQLISTPRSNAAERGATQTVDELKIELDGYTNEAGEVVAKGLHSRLSQAIRVISDILFPKQVANTQPVIRDASHLW